MKKTHNRKNKLLAFLLSVMMISSMGAAFASCTNDEESSSSTTEEEETSSKTDNGIIKNSNFDFTTLSDTTLIGTSVTGWSRSVNSASTGTAGSSKSASGVIDTAADAWDYLTERKYTDDEIETYSLDSKGAFSDTWANKNWDSLKAGDKLAFYDIWEEYNEDETLSSSTFSSYESLNIDAEDVPDTLNPGTHSSDLEDTQVLMIHNNNTIGTAQKYTSSTTVTVEAGTSMKFSVWVKTADLTSVNSAKEEQAAVGKGAYISVTNSVGGSSLASYEVKNIQADEWKQYTFYLKGSSYASTTFSVVLGLGQSGGTDHLDYVNGYAFFDDIQCEVIENSDFDELSTATGNVKASVGIETEKADKTVDAYLESTYDTFLLDYYGNAEWADVYDEIFSNATADLTKVTNGSLNSEKNEKDFVKTSTLAALKTEAENNEYLKAIYDNFLTKADDEEYFVADDQDLYMILSAQGAAYTVESPYTFEMDKDTNYMALSFYVKTSDLSKGTGLGVSVVEGLDLYSISSINTYNLTGVTIGDDEDAYDGWQKCYFFITKTEDLMNKDASFTLKFTYGPTDISISNTKADFVPGFAALTGFQTYNMTKLEYDCASTDTYTQKVTLVGDTETDTTGNGGFDAAQGVPTDALETGLADLQNYKGVYSNSIYVTYSSEADRTVNGNENAGLLNKEQFANYYNEENAPAWLAGIKAATGKTDATEAWNAFFGADTTQPLLIWNGDSTYSYGYIGSATSIAASASDYTTISVRVKTSANAVASVYLIDMDDETADKAALSIGRSTSYWYDDNGNVYSADSVHDEDPNNTKSVAAFKLNAKNGLYTANKNWKGYADLENKTAYYANLSAYTVNADGNLVAASDSAEHSYYDYTWDREVFYGYNGNYYTKPNGEGDLVLDFSAHLVPRYEANDSAALKAENLSTDGEWAYVTFYVKTGIEAKNYRLEVWSGTRDNSAVNGKDTYVIFDTNNPGSSAAALLEEYKDLDGAVSFEDVYSYYDTDKHVRYDEALDNELVGNLYSYTASSYASGIAYLYYQDGDHYNYFADYSLSEQTITASAVSDDEDSDDSDNDTTESDTNIWLLASSIVVAAVLILVVILIVVRKIVEKARKKNGTFVARKKTKKAKKD